MMSAKGVFFQDEKEQTLRELLGLPVEAECQFWTQPEPSNDHSETASGKSVLLQIIWDFVVERCAQTQEIKSLFKCDYQIQFEILRKETKIPSKLGQAVGISFNFRQQKIKIDLTARMEAEQKVEEFGKKLERKFIVQLGFHATFKAIKRIGKGMTACVFNALCHANGNEVAIKSFKRSTYFASQNNNGKISFLKEFQFLTKLKHKNICEMISVYESDHSTYIIMELLPLSLYGYIQKMGFPSEEIAKKIIYNLLEGIAYMHERGVMHRDLKLENIMIRKDSSDVDSVVPVIVDMGLAEYIDAKKYLYTRCGTPGYVAPEVLRIKSVDPVQTYSEVCDVFSLGVIFHILLFKKPLFEGKELKEVIQKNCDCVIDFQNDNFSKLSPEALEFIRGMLAKDPNMRLSAKKALQHPYLACIDKLSPKLAATTFFSTQQSIRE